MTIEVGQQQSQQGADASAQQGQQSNTSAPPTAPDGAALAERLAFLEAEAKRAFAARDAAKAEAAELRSLKEAQAQAEMQKKIDAGKLQEVLSDYQRQLAEAREQAELGKRYMASLEAEYQQGIAQLSEDERALIPSSASLEDRMRLVKGLVAKRAPANRAPAPAVPPLPQGYSQPQMTLEALSNLGAEELDKVVKSMKPEERRALIAAARR